METQAEQGGGGSPTGAMHKGSTVGMASSSQVVLTQHGNGQGVPRTQDTGLLSSQEQVPHRGKHHR